MTAMENSPSTTSPICSVCIANYNGADVIEDCLNSVFAQNCDFSFEVIVHDDASTDGSIDIVCDRYLDVIVIHSKKNVGFCISNNRMVAQARGKYILLLNNDAALFPDALAALKKEAEQIGKPAILTLPQYDAETGQLLDIGSLLDPFLNSVPNLDPDRNEVGMVAGACLWIPRPLWQELGGFPEWFGSIGEDLYLCCQARLTGYTVCALGISGYRHRVGGSFGGGKVLQGRLATTRRRRSLSERNKTFVMITCYPWMLLLVLLPVHLVILFVEGALIAILKRDAGLWRDIYAPLLPSIWGKRNRLRKSRAIIQGKRKMSVKNFFAVFSFFPYKLKMLMKYGLPEVR
jgi:GT2 family glycosyltransferase